VARPPVHWLTRLGARHHHACNGACLSLRKSLHA